MLNLVACFQSPVFGLHHLDHNVVIAQIILIVSFEIALGLDSSLSNLLGKDCKTCISSPLRCVLTMRGIPGAPCRQALPGDEEVSRGPRG